MAKKANARVIVVSEDIQSLIDRGLEVDTELKNLTYEDKGLKVQISASVNKSFNEGETMIRAEGKSAAVHVTRVEKIELDASSPEFAVAEAAIKSGRFPRVFTVKKILTVPPDKVDFAYVVLKQMGLDPLIKTDYEINPEEFRILVGSSQSTTEALEAVHALDKCSKRNVLHRISYTVK